MNKKKIIAVLFGAGVLFGFVPMVALAGGSFFIDDTTGYVGIGNTTPAARLDVAGAMYSRMVTASSSAIDWNAGNVQSMTLSSNPTLTFSNGQAGGEYKLILNQDSTGGRTIIWPSSVAWSGGIPPTLSRDPDATDVISFVNNGSNFLGSYTLNLLTTPPVGVCAIYTHSLPANDNDDLGLNSGNQKIGQSFTPSANCTVSAIGAVVRNFGGTPGDAFYPSVYSDSSGTPGTLLGSGGNFPSLSSSFAWATSTVSSTINLAGGTSYWVVWSRTSSVGSPYFNFADESGLGTVGASYDGSSWTANGAEFLFEVDGSSY